MTRVTHIQTIDLALRSIAKRRAALDAEEARWLREAEVAHIWKPLGMVSMLDYLERALGYTPRVALERLRVARALAELPVLTEALAAGALPFSALRELTRVAVPATEAEWCSEAIGKNLREIEELVATHQRGDRPSDATVVIRAGRPAAVQRSRCRRRKSRERAATRSTLARSTRRAGACGAGHPAEGAPLRVAPRSRALRRAGMPVRPEPRAPPPGRARRRWVASSE